MITKWLRQLFGAVRQVRRSPHRSSCVRSTPRPTARLWLETLESRYAPTVTVSVIGTVLTAQCDNAVVNTVTIDHDSGTSSANINGTIVPDAMYASIEVHGGTMGTVTNLLANVAPVTILDLGPQPADVANIGNAGSLSGIQGSVLVENEPDYTAINIHDEADAAAHTAVIDMVSRAPADPTALGRVTGIGAADITWDYFDTASVNLYFGSGTSTVNVLATADANGTQATTSIFNTGPATINLGNAGSLADFRAPLNLENEPNFDTVYINDYADAAAHTAVIDAVARPLDPDQSSLGRLTGLGVAAITWDYFDTSAVNVNLGSGTSIVNVLATGNVAAGTTYATTTNIFNIAAATINVGNAGSLAGILGQLNLENEPDYDTVMINDQADAANSTASITTISRSPDSSLGALNGLGSAAQITWDYLDTASVTINSGTGFNIWHIEGTGVSTTINGTLGTNAFVVCQASQDLSNIVGALTLQGSGAADVVEFFDQANPNSETYTFNSVPSSLSLTAEPVAVNFTGVGSVYLETNGMSTVVDPSSTVLVDTGTEPY